MASTSTSVEEIPFKLNGAVDHNGAALYADITVSPNDDSTIAPWIDEPPTPPPKPPSMQSSGSKSSSLMPQHQNGGFSFRFRRPSASRSVLSVSERNRRSVEEGDSVRSLHQSETSSSSGELRRQKSSRLLSILRSRPSKGQLASDSVGAEHPSLLPPLPPRPEQYASFLDISPSESPSTSSFGVQLMKKRGKQKRPLNGSASSSPPSIDKLHHIQLDTDIDNMDGIIDPSLASSSTYMNDVNARNVPGLAIKPPIIPPTSILPYVKFNNPHSRTSAADKRKGIRVVPLEDCRKPSPSQETSSSMLPDISLSSSSALVHKQSWAPPQSWDVAGENPLDDDDSGSEDGVVNGGHRKSKMSRQRNGADDFLSSTDSLPHYPHSKALPPEDEFIHSHRQFSFDTSYTIPIYQDNDSSVIITVSFNVPVADLIPTLNKRFLLGESKLEHRLYVKDRGGERVLSQTERPAKIIKRRLEQAGYDPEEGLDLLGLEGLSFLVEFVYKSQVLGAPIGNDLTFETFDFIDLTGRSLRTIPVILHQNADSIISLKLSRNPMLEIPLDFIQSCTTLRDLRLSNMAMKRVPQSVQHSTTLHRLDLSSNRISDLEEAHLEKIPSLMTLFLQNNRIERLPESMQQMRSLVTLNISNNKLRSIPMTITQIKTLEDLDVSFNAIVDLPAEIGLLRALRRLIIVGNRVSKFPSECSTLLDLQFVDCRRNQISDLSVICILPKIREISADHNTIHAIRTSFGPNLLSLDVSHNDITQLALAPIPVGSAAYTLTSLDLSHARLSSLDDIAWTQLSSLQTLKLDHNSFRFLPDSLGELTWLETLSCSDNKLDALPTTIGNLHNLVTLDAHNNSLTELPQSLWNCSSLTHINLTSNFLGIWHDPPVSVVHSDTSGDDETFLLDSGRKPSSASIANGLPPLAHSLMKLYIGENRLTDDVLHPLMVFRELQVLNLSFNEIQDLPPSFFRNLTSLREIYLSGNKLTSLPTEDLFRLSKLTTLFLNGNKFQTLPQELRMVKSLTVLDVGSNLLKYNINNLEFDWNWNFNKDLRYLNLSGNNRLQIKPDITRSFGNNRRSIANYGRQSISGFTDLTNLRVLGLMDVTITTTGNNTTVDIPDEHEDRRVRTSLSMVNKMPYGIADSLGSNEYLTMLDLVQELVGRPGEAIFAMFGSVQLHKTRFPVASPNRLSKLLHDRFIDMFQSQLNALDPDLGDTIPDALRRTFLKLNQDLHDSLFTNRRKMSHASISTKMADPATLRSGASGIVLYIKEKTVYVANVGDALAVISRQGMAEALSTRHDPYDRSETSRIREAEGWVSPTGLVNDEVDVSRSFGFYHLLPVVNARPDVRAWNFTELDEFIIVANRGLWDYVPYQTAVDIARTVARLDPMIAAQKLRDFAISYGADSSTMIMVICVGDLFNSQSRPRQLTLESIVDPYRSRRRDDILDRNIARLDGEVPPPTGHLCLVFTDIRNSTHLWETNPGMPTAMRVHNSLLRRHLRFCGGYEVKTEGDAFMCAFPTALAAVWWCLVVQNQLLHEPWPMELLECEDGKPIYDAEDRLIARGLSVRMGLHCGMPVCEPDPITHRMDYFGPIVNRTARVSGSAAGGQIMCSADIMREINVCIFGSEPETEFSRLQPMQAIDAIRQMEIVVVPVGEVKLKGLEVPEILSLVYPTHLIGRQELKEQPVDSSASSLRIQFSVSQIQELGMLCLRLEALASGRIFRLLPIDEGIFDGEILEEPKYMTGDPLSLLPQMNDKLLDTDFISILDSLSVRIVNAISTLGQAYSKKLDKCNLISTISQDGVLDDQMLQAVLSILQRV